MADVKQKAGSFDVFLNTINEQDQDQTKAAMTQVLTLLNDRGGSYPLEKLEKSTNLAWRDFENALKELHRKRLVTADDEDLGADLGSVKLTERGKGVLEFPISKNQEKF